jgi:hypothetical protein
VSGLLILSDRDIRRALPLDRALESGIGTTVAF